MNMHGPQRWIKSRNHWVPKARATIEAGTILLEGQEDEEERVLELLENDLSIHVIPGEYDYFHIYHSYKYLQRGQLCYGRWYDTHVPRAHLQELPGNCLTKVIDDFELEMYGDTEDTARATITVKLTEIAAAKIRTLAAVTTLHN